MIRTYCMYRTGTRTIFHSLQRFNAHLNSLEPSVYSPVRTDAVVAVTLGPTTYSKTSYTITGRSIGEGARGKAVTQEPCK